MAERILNKKVTEVTLSGEVTVVFSDSEVTGSFDELVESSQAAESHLWDLVGKRFMENPTLVLAKISAAAEAIKMGVGEVSYLPNELGNTKASEKSPVVM